MEKELCFEKPVFNVPPDILENWMEHYQISLANGNDTNFQGLLFTEPRYLKNCKEIVRVYGARLIDGVFYIKLYGKAAKDIDAVIVAESDTEKNALQYIAFYDGIEKEKYFGSNMLQYMDRPTMGVGAILWHKNQDKEIELLLGRRVKGPPAYINRLSNFGGIVEIGETLWEALQRELKEEVGLVIPPLEGKVAPQLLNSNITIHQYANGYTYHAYSATFALEVINKDVVKNMEPHKTRNFGWYKLNDLIANPEDLTPLCKESILEWI